MRKCPKCSSYNAEPYLYQSIEVIKCSECGFDQGEELEQFPTEKSNQKAKGRYTPYRAGGSKRARKK